MWYSSLISAMSISLQLFMVKADCDNGILDKKLGQ